MHVCVGKLMKRDRGCCIQPMGKGRIKLTYVKVMIIQYLHTFFGGKLQMVHGDPLRPTCVQNLPCQKASEFCLISDKIEN